MLLPAFILVTVDGEHDGLQERIDLGQSDKSTEMRNVPRFCLEEEKQIAVFLSLLVIREEAFLDLGSVVEMARNLVLLHHQSFTVLLRGPFRAYLFQGHAILNKQGYPRVQISHVLLQHEVLL